MILYLIHLCLTLSQKINEHLVRCYMSVAQGDQVRKLIDKNPNNQSCCFLYNNVLLEHISLMLDEEGSSIKVKNETLKRGKSLHFI